MDYLYSSYNEYTDGNGSVDCEFVFDMISKKEIEEYHKQINYDNCLEIAPSLKKRVTDEQAKKLIQKHTKCNCISDFQMLDESKKEKTIKKFYGLGFSIRQISRLTGETKGKVEKWLK